jgi:uncharacterized protein (TIGR02453 family)
MDGVIMMGQSLFSASKHKSTMATLQKSSIDFLKKIKANNNRDWFADNKPLYQEELEKMQAFAEELLLGMNSHDNIDTPSGKKSLHRIYRDVRFSKNKSPYKENWGGGFHRATQQLRGGYYYHIEPGNSFVGGGFWGPNKDDLARIRQAIDHSQQEFREVFADPTFIKTFGELKGDGVKTAPKGYSVDHPAIDLLRKKQFVVMRQFSDKEVLSADFLGEVVQTFKNMRPYLNLMSEVLTTDVNGVPLYD